MPQLLVQTADNSPHLTLDDYQQKYRESIENPEAFWETQASHFIHWFEPWEKVLSGGFDRLDVKWFQGGKLNAAYNCLDRHLLRHSEKPAILWEGDDPNETATLTYQQLYEQVCRLAKGLKSLGISKGDKVCIYLPMIPEAVIAMLACARIGAVHSVVFAGFSAQALQDRIQDADCRLVMTANVSKRGGKQIPLKENVDKAIEHCPTVEHIIVVKRTDDPVVWSETRDIWYHNLLLEGSIEPEIMDAMDPLFILYTSGSTGKPKGILHGTGGYLVYAAMTFYYVFDYHNKEIYWCTADVGWITGHTYNVYGPLLNGATIVLFEGVPTFPTPARFWQVIDKYKVNIFYTAPTAIRALRREGDQWVKQSSRQSLRLLGTVGEPINVEAWQWYADIVGQGRCPVVDTWWQTETGGIMITPIPWVTPAKAGSAGWPFFGVMPDIINEKGETLPPGQMGYLTLNQPWPGMMQTVYGDTNRFSETYFKTFPGKYLTSDQAYQDEEGYFWIEGRSDDVIKVSGHRIGSQEVENALVMHPAVAEAAVVGAPDSVKGQQIYAFVTLKQNQMPSDMLKDELIQTVRQSIGAIAAPQIIQWAEGLPKTRSGKIMRRLLRKMVNNEQDQLGDLTTLADPSVMEALLKSYQG